MISQQFLGFKNLSFVGDICAFKEEQRHIETKKAEPFFGPASDT